MVRRTQNLLLRALGEAAVSALEPKPVDLTPLQGLDETEGVYFIDAGLISVMASEDDLDLGLQVGLVGREGLIGLNSIYGDRSTAFRNVTHGSGNALAVQPKRFRALMTEDPEALALMLRFARAFSIQVAATAIANGRSKLDERVARWLLMVGDRMGPSFPLTHEALAKMLGVRRSGVTIAIQTLEVAGYIRARRGSLVIVDRDGLLSAANGSYGYAERHYERLLGRASVRLTQVGQKA